MQLFFMRIISKLRFFNREVESLTILNNFMMKIVNERRQQLGTHDYPNPLCTLDYYLTTQIGGELLSDKEVCTEINSAIFAAHQTVKTTLTFLFYSLAKHSDVQQKVYDEVKLVLGDQFDYLDSDHVKDLSYTEAAIFETLRLYPVFPFIGRKLKSEITIGDLTFPKDVEILISPFMMGRNPKYFKDPLAFNPDRFLGLKTPPHGFIPFSIGARQCIGDKIGVNVGKILTAKICSRFKVSLARDYNENLGLVWNLTLQPKERISLFFHERIDQTNWNNKNNSRCQNLISLNKIIFKSHKPQHNQIKSSFWFMASFKFTAHIH